MQLMLWFVTNDVAYLVLLTLEASVADVLFRLLLSRLGSNLPLSQVFWAASATAGP
jgi:hypothetical protein